MERFLTMLFWMFSRAKTIISQAKYLYLHHFYDCFVHDIQIKTKRSIMQVITTVNGSHVFRNAPTLQTMILKKAVTLLLVISIKKDKDKNVVPVNVRFMKKHVSWTRKTCVDKWQGPVSHAWCHQSSIFVMIQLSQFMFWSNSNSWIKGVSF